MPAKMTKELQEATKEFDEEFVAERGKPMSPEMRRRGDRAKAKSSNGQASLEETIAVKLEKTLLDRCALLAKKKRLSRDTLIARSLGSLKRAGSF